MTAAEDEELAALRVEVARLRERIERAEEVAYSERLLEELGNHLPLLFWVRDVATGALLYANPRWARLLGRPPVLGEHFHQLLAAVHPEDRARVLAALNAATVTGLDEILRLIDEGAGVRWLHMRTFVIRTPDGRPHRIAGFGEDITEQKQMLEALRASETKYRELFESAHVGIFRANAERDLRDSEARYRSVVDAMSSGIVVHGPDGLIVAANAAAERILGLTVDQMMGRTSLDPRWRAIREDGSPLPGEEHPGWVTLRTGEPQTGVIMGVHKPSGELTWISVNSRRVTPLGEEGAYSVVATFTDITEKKRVDERMLASLREKEVLLKEVHHRVKNNLQIVTSLLYLQAARTDDPRLAELLRESRNRIASIALVHQMLYQTPDLSRIPFDTYVRDLAHSLYGSYGISTDRIALRVRAQGLILSVGAGVPCGLVLNEILSNALKYAFPGGARGTVAVELELLDDQYRLRVADDGVGLPEDIDRRARSSLGMKLIERLAAQLGGTLRRESCTKGTSYELRFPAENAA